MAFTVSNALVSALTRIGQLNVSKATGGSTTTIVDTTLPTDGADDDAWKEGFAIVTRDAGGAAAAPEAEFARISAFVVSTGTFTLDTALTTAVASGDQYGFTSPQFTLQNMLRLLNEALLTLGDVPLVDTTTLDTVAGQTEYAAAVAWKRRRPLQIDVQGRVGASTDNKWRTIYEWDWIPAGAGSTGLIVFHHYPIGSRDIRIHYLDRHPAVNAFGDAINERFDPEMVANALILKIREQLMERDDGTDEGLLRKFNKANALFDTSMAKHTPEKPRRRPRILTLGGSNNGDPDRITPPPAV